MRNIASVFIIIWFFECTTSQYLNINRKPPKPPSCESSGKTALVEHFFNIIFTEFHSTPPVCVCVQMCADQSTYCYPNGCLKREEKNKPNDNLQQVSIQNGNTRPSIFFVDQKSDFMADLLSKGYGEDVKLANTEKVYINELRPDPFKDKYKSIFKYKKMPNVELRYNLREQVKNMKSDVLKIETIDVSKTRWPMKKHSKLNGHDEYSDVRETKPSLINNNKFFLSTYPDNQVYNSPPRYSKRDLTNLNENGVNLKAIYSVDQSDNSVQNANFSLEALIDNLIESSFNTNNTEFEINIDLLDSKSEEINRKLPIEVVVQENLLNNETTKVVSMNTTNENLDKNKYAEETAGYTNMFSDMITSLSKKIDTQNNTSMEMIGRVNGEIEIAENVATVIPEKVSINTETTIRETLNPSEVTNIPDTQSEMETENIPQIISQTEVNQLNTKEEESPANQFTDSTTDNEAKTTKKSRQRILKKLQNSKNN